MVDGIRIKKNSHQTFLDMMITEYLSTSYFNWLFVKANKEILWCSNKIQMQDNIDLTDVDEVLDQRDIF